MLSVDHVSSVYYDDSQKVEPVHTANVESARVSKRRKCTHWAAIFLTPSGAFTSITVSTRLMAQMTLHAR